MMKTLISCVNCILFASFLSACATQQNLDTGTVISSIKIKNNDYLPHQTTASTAIAGAQTGAIITGAFYGLALGGIVASFGAAPIYIAEGLIAGSAAGALIGGAIGGATGAGIGYVSDVYHQGAGLFQYTIKPDNKTESIYVTQYVTKPIPLHAKVQIYLEDNLPHIKEIETTHMKSKE